MPPTSEAHHTLSLLVGRTLSRWMPEHLRSAAHTLQIFQRFLDYARNDKAPSLAST
jgi:hypothetical protein